MYAKGVQNKRPKVFLSKFPDFSIHSFLLLYTTFYHASLFKNNFRMLFRLSITSHIYIFFFYFLFYIKKLFQEYIYFHIRVPMIHWTSHKFNFPINLPLLHFPKYQSKIYISVTQKNIIFLSHFASYFHSRYNKFWHFAPFPQSRCWYTHTLHP
jgi:hypothetical protein